jgi:two-component system OmpR family sensor kinase
MSITARLIIGMTLTIGLLWLSAAGIARNVFAHEFKEVFSENLQSTAARLLPLAAHMRDETRPDATGQQGAPDDLALFMGEATDRLAFELRDRTGIAILRTRDSGDLFADVRMRAGFYETPDTLFFTQFDAVSGMSITVATSTSHQEEAVMEATRTLLWPMLGLLAAATVAAFLVARLFLAPIGQIRKQIAERDGGNLTALESQTLPRELRPIATSVNRLMQRLQKALNAERAFAANSAHELRTPIAGALAQVQQLRSEIGTGKGHARAAAIESALKRLSNLSAKLLQMTRADSGLGLVSERQDLTPVFKAVVAEFTGRATTPLSVTVSDNLHQDLMVQMDPDAFGIVLRNLIENAERHGPENQHVQIAIGSDWTISVANTGPVVPAPVLDTLKERYRRGHTTSEGSGLGLAIVEDIMAHSGGMLTLYSPARGMQDGFEAVVTLP